jgi:signal transduction histidine kinase
MARTVTLRTKFSGVLIVAMIILLTANLLWSYYSQKNATQSELLEESRTLSTMMTSIWDFASINKETINTSSTGVYDYKGLHCSLVGKAVGAIFSKNSDYSFRFVNSTPRNPDALPDGFESQALESFHAGGREYYGFSEYRGEQVFRYVYVMNVNKNCMECHGAPRGELDISGFPKEGWEIGDIAGAGSIIVPVDIPMANMRNDLIQSVIFSVAAVLLATLIIYFTLFYLVLSPISSLQRAFRRVGKGDVDYRIRSTQSSLYSSREMASVLYSFNHMTDELSQLYHSLEERVSLRTEELREANHELELQRKQLYEVNAQLRQESIYKTDFLAMVSHELRTPLTSILAFAGLLRSSLPEEDHDAKEQLDRIVNNSQQLLELINNLLDTARIESGKQVVQKEVVDLYDTVGAVVDFIKPLAEAKGIKLKMTSKKGIPLIESDPDLIARALQNFMSNAIKFTPEGGSVVVHIGIDTKDRAVALSVADTGIGISPGQQKVIFERFIQSDMSINRSYGGSGLGLALCREVALLLNGSIEVKSELGVGSTFTIILPIEEKGECGE